MADYFSTDNLSVEDESDLKTGDVRKKHNSPCGKGYKSVKGKCVRKKSGSKKK